jgi:hypothetical protein
MLFEDDDLDYGDEHKPKATNEAIAAIHAEIDRAVAAEKREAELEEALKSCKKRREQITNEIIPRMMRDNGLTEIVTPNGVKVSINKSLFASIPAYTTINKEKDSDRRKELIQRREAAIKWLEDNGHESIIKRSFEIQFGKNEKAKAEAFKADVLKRGDGLHFSEGLDVHHMTLSSLVRELHKESTVFPWDVLGVAEKEVAVVSAVRPK